MAKNISCNFIDARIASKEYVKDNHVNCLYENQSGRFNLSTCLRSEHYSFSEARFEQPFYYTEGISCLRRLLSVATGLQSEIPGEMEIHGQICDAVKTAQTSGNLSNEQSAAISVLLNLAKIIRNETGFSTGENYSTIAADLVADHLKNTKGDTVAIVGGGYMADKFFSSLLASESRELKKIYWINRSVSKLRRSLEEIIDLLEADVEIIPIDAAQKSLEDSDTIFCALANSPDRFSGANLKKGSFVVDVSYPQVMPALENTNLVNISNTHFDRLVKKPLEREPYVEANALIDWLCGRLETSCKDG